MASNKTKLEPGLHVISGTSHKREVVIIEKMKSGKMRSTTKHQIIVGKEWAFPTKSST